MEEATRRHFFNHGRDGNDEEKSNCHWCQLRCFPTHYTAPITIVNDLDSHILPENFRFINDVVLGNGVQAADSHFRSGCTCSHSEDCQYSDCLCLGEVDQCESSAGEDSDDGHCRTVVLNNTTPKKMYAYHSHGSKAGLLRSRLRLSKLPLYECHAGCSCTSDCPNRVVERGRTVPLQIFRTKDRGWGVRTRESIKKGQFVDRYLGEIITSAEADQRRAASIVSQRKDVYLFALDKFTDPHSLDPRLKGPSLEVDGEFMSGPTRFINHSCEPNLRIFARVGDHADKHIHDLALFAVKDILRGEELTFDYVDGAAEDDFEEHDRNVEDMMKCLCGSAGCRKFLW